MGKHLYVIHADPHANAEAVKAVFEHMDQHINARYTLVCLGDYTGYGPFPNEVIQAYRQRTDVVKHLISGNHDHVSSFSEHTEFYNPFALTMIFWNRNVLSQDNKDWLSCLPKKMSVDDRLKFVHGAPESPESYIMNHREAMEQRAFLSEPNRTKLVFFGHSHKRSLYHEQDLERYDPDKGKQEYNVSEEEIFFINPGSIGQRRDGIRTAQECIGFASYGMLELDDNSNGGAKFTFVNVPYSTTRMKQRYHEISGALSDIIESDPILQADFVAFYEALQAEKKHVPSQDKWIPTGWEIGEKFLRRIYRGK
ncbi:MAG: metallophosphoesterase family protein [Candidatus Woesearchaeota archaeon]